MLNAVLAIALSQTQPNLMARVRQALLLPNTAGWTATRISGKADCHGVKDDYTLDYGPDGRFVQTFRGPIGETFGYDGKTFWEVDRSDGVEKLDFEDRDRQIATDLVLTSGWLGSSAPVTISEQDGTLHLKLKTSEQDEVLKIDPTTGLPTEANLPISSGLLVIKLSEWKPAGDRLVPTHIEITDGGMTDTIFCDAPQSETLSADSFRVPDWKPDDISFDPSKPAEAECKRAVTGHLLVHPLIDGKDLGWFILDSGAEVMCIDKATADDAKIPSIGREPVTGVGGNVESTFRPVDEFVLGPATMRHVFFCDLDLRQLSGFFGVKIAGIVGADFFRRAIITVDLKGPSVEIAKRDGFALPSGGWLPVRFSTGNPTVEAAIDGAPKSWYRFDLGANGLLTLHAPFVTKWKLLDGKTTKPVLSGGAGGFVSARAGTVKWFELGGHRFENPTVDFSTATQGAFTEPYLAGNIGQDAMMPFRVVFDFSGYRIALIAR